MTGSDVVTHRGWPCAAPYERGWYWRCSCGSVGALRKSPDRLATLFARHHGPIEGEWTVEPAALQPLVEQVAAALEPLGFESVVLVADGTEPCASISLGGVCWLDITATAVGD